MQIEMLHAFYNGYIIVIMKEKKLESIRDIREHRNMLINKLYHNEGHPITNISEVFNVNRSTISRIINT